MNGYAGLTLHSHSKDIAEFTILEGETDSAISSLINLIESGYIVTLSDNRDRRAGSISLKHENNQYYQEGGGHGFHSPWREANKVDIIWLIKATAQFNLSRQEDRYGTFQQSR